MNKSKSKSKKSDKESGSKDDSKTSDSKMNTGGGGGGGGIESPAATPSQTHHSTSASSASAAANSSATPVSASSSTGPPSAMSKPTPGNWFASEIQQMMHGFGDCRKPLAESASLIEEIVHQQMVTFLYQASDVASMRNARFMGIEDFLFLLRKDEVKIRRLIKYLTFKDKAASLKFGAGMEDDEMAELGEGKQPTRKKRKICYDFLSSIDQTGELIALFDDDGLDDIKQERALRADLQTRQMDTQQYMEYCEARHTSFTAQKFKDWLMMGVTLDLKPNPLAMKVLSYLAYEIVAQIVDLALLVKRDMSSSVEDPFATAMPSVCLNYDSTVSMLQAKPQSSSTSTKSPSRAASPTATTPPSTPTAPSPMSTTPGGGGGSTPATPAPSGGQSATTSSSSNSSKAKAKKRKKSDSQSSKELYYQPIQPRDIREALRRYSQAIGPFADFSKSPMISPKTKILCC